MLETVLTTIDADPLMKRILLYIGKLDLQCAKTQRFGAAVAKELRTPYSGYLKEKLAALRKRGVFVAGQGIFLTDLGKEIYEILKDRTKSS